MLKRISIDPQFKGYLYHNNRLEKQLQPGLYWFPFLFTKVDVYSLPTTTLSGHITNQEVLSNDNISLRLSLYYTYTIIDGEKYIANTEPDSLQNFTPSMYLQAGDTRISMLIQERVREAVAGIKSDELNTRRHTIVDLVAAEDLSSKLDAFGLKLEDLHLIDISFPKNIQEIFATELSSKIRANVDLENARTAVATTRTYKNASEISRNDEGVRYIQLLEALQRIAQKGNHTFVIGDQPIKK